MNLDMKAPFLESVYMTSRNAGFLNNKTLKMMQNSRETTMLDGVKVSKDDKNQMFVCIGVGVYGIVEEKHLEEFCQIINRAVIDGYITHGISMPLMRMTVTEDGKPDNALVLNTFSNYTVEELQKKGIPAFKEGTIPTEILKCDSRININNELMLTGVVIDRGLSANHEDRIDVNGIQINDEYLVDTNFNNDTENIIGTAKVYVEDGVLKANFKLKHDRMKFGKMPSVYPCVGATIIRREGDGIVSKSKLNAVSLCVSNKDDGIEPIVKPASPLMKQKHTK